MPDFSQLLRYAAPLGGSITVLLVLLASATWILRIRYRLRLLAIEKADPSDLPGIVGDEIDKLRITADGLPAKHRRDVVMTVLMQRELRNQRVFRLALVISLLMTIITLTAFAVSAQSARDEQCDGVVIDDVLSSGWPYQAKGLPATSRLEIRVRNPSSSAANITRAAVRFEEESAKIAAVDSARSEEEEEGQAGGSYRHSAAYDLAVHGMFNEIPIAHVLQSNEVDAFVLDVGRGEHAPRDSARVILRYNGSCEAKSDVFRFEGFPRGKSTSNTESRPSVDLDEPAT
jgi:hypothetical protein